METIQLCIIFRFDQLADKRRERNAPVLHSLKDKHILTEEAVETRLYPASDDKATASRAPKSSADPA